MIKESVFTQSVKYKKPLHTFFFSFFTLQLVIHQAVNVNNKYTHQNTTNIKEDRQTMLSIKLIINRFGV